MNADGPILDCSDVIEILARCGLGDPDDGRNDCRFQGAIGYPEHSSREILQFGWLAGHI